MGNKFPFEGQCPAENLGERRQGSVGFKWGGNKACVFSSAILNTLGPVSTSSSASKQKGLPCVLREFYIQA